MPGVQVRPVQPAEYELAGRIVLSAYESLPGNHMTGGYAEVLADVGRRAGEAEVLVPSALTPRLRNVRSRRLLAMGGAPGPGEAGVRMLAVDPSVQGRGVGRALLDACTERARRLGRSGLFLHSAPWMEAAHHLYESAGFVRLPERDWLPVPEVPLMAFRLALPRTDEAQRTIGVVGSSDKLRAQSTHARVAQTAERRTRKGCRAVGPGGCTRPEQVFLGGSSAGEGPTG